MSPDYATTNISGTNPHGNVEIDEALEETGVADTKQNDPRRTAQSLRKSFYTASNLRAAFVWLEKSVRQKSKQGLWKTSNFEKKLCRGALKMYQHLCGSDDRQTWLGVEHCGMELLTNNTVTPYLAVSRREHDRLLKLREISLATMDRSAVRFVPEIRARAPKHALSEAHAKKTDKLEHFSEAHRLREKRADKKDVAAKVKQKSLLCSLRCGGTDPSSWERYVKYSLQKEYLQKIYIFAGREQVSLIATLI